MRERIRSALFNRRVLFGIPFFWLLLFFLLPFALILKISLTSAVMAIPPYEPVFRLVDNTLSVVLNFGNFLFLMSDSLYIAAYWGSIKTAFISTAACLLIGYPMAYAMARAPRHWQLVFLLMVMLPSWTSFLIRVYAWMGILGNQGLLNAFLMWLGLVDEPLKMLNTNFAVILGITYAYLPFMVLPIYTTLVKLDGRLLEAASDLGCRSPATFWTITLPLSKAGILAGCMLVFIPAVGEFVIPELLGGPDTLMIGKVLWEEFFNNRDWPVASALAIVMLALLLIPIVLFHRFQSREMSKNG
ncbi:ABC transporter permease subunit [Marinobacter sp.]|uniref:ABC transporter permease subunit n=1 Tax=Marinobacter sp. TaxID=50741 RepID=UPI003A915686